MFQYLNYKLVVSVAAIPAAAYICWKLYPKAEKNKKDSKLQHFVPGLINSGNTCFMNSTLQCMASLSNFVGWLSQFSQLSHVCNNVLLAETLNEIIKKLNGDCDENVFDSSNLLLDLVARGWQIASEEHDAHEFFHCLMSTLDEEVKYYLKYSMHSTLQGLVNTNSNFVVPHEGEPVASKFNISQKSETLAIIRDVKQNSFHGLLSIRLQCSQCGHKNPVSYESFHSLSLPIDCSRGKTLMECLHSFLACEMLSNVECAACTKKKQKHSKSFSNPKKVCSDSKFMKVSKSVHSTLTTSKMSNQMLQPKQFKTKTNNLKEKNETASFFKLSHITKFPQCLCIHLKRLVWRYGQPIKLYHQVSYPEILDLKNFRFKYVNKCHNKNRLYMDPIFSSIVKTRPKCNLLAMRTAAGLNDVEKQNGLVKPQACSKHFIPSQLYQLTGVLVHLGDWSCHGHFIAYRRHVLRDAKGSLSTQWYYTSDDNVKKVSVHDVLSHPAYMLFYEKIDIEKHD